MKHLTSAHESGVKGMVKIKSFFNTCGGKFHAEELIKS